MPMSRREIRGLQIVAEKGVSEIGGGLFKVKSQSGPGKSHIVIITGGKRICDCTDFQRTKKCKHVHAVKYYTMLKYLALNAQSYEENALPACIYCGSTHVVRAGYRYNKSGPVQRYRCKSCRRWFRDPNGFERRQFNSHTIATAIDLYCRGLSLREVADHLKSAYNIEVSYGTIYAWIRRYVELVDKYTSNLSKHTSERWCADETVVRVKSRNLLLWTLLDYESRLLIAYHISTNRTAAEASSLVRKGLQSTGPPPLEFVSDGNTAYSKALESETKPCTPILHIVGPLAGPITNNRSERLNKTVKRRVKKAIHFNSMDGTETFMKAFGIHYNFVRPHHALGNSTPAEKAEIMEKASWRELIKLAARRIRENSNP